MAHNELMDAVICACAEGSEVSLELNDREDARAYNGS